MIPAIRMPYEGHKFELLGVIFEVKKSKGTFIKAEGQYKKPDMKLMGAQGKKFNMLGSQFRITGMGFTKKGEKMIAKMEAVVE